MHVGLLVALVLSVAGVVRAKTPPTRCEAGRFSVDGGDLFDTTGGDASHAVRVGRHVVGGGTTHGRFVALADGQVSIDGVCPATEAHLRFKKSRTKVRATWRNCDGITGTVRLRASIDTADCTAMAGRLRAKKARVDRTFSAVRTLGNPEDCTGEDTFGVIQREIFGPKGCRVETCHGSSKAANLDLRWGAAHYALVDVTADNPDAAAAGKRRVVPGDADASFLVQKLEGLLESGEGSAMPSVGTPLDELQLALVRAWIDDGAPATGVVPAAPCLPKRTFEAAQPLPLPEGGVQFVLDGPVLQPGEEIEGCVWVQVPPGPDLVFDKVEYSINPGSHHFAIWEHERAEAPTIGVFDPDDLACAAQGARFGITLSGAPETPYFVDSLPAGIGKALPGGSYLGLNPHYFNEFDVPIQVKGWINFIPVESPPAHLADTLLSLSAALDGKTTYSIEVPPFSTASLRLRWYNQEPLPLQIFKLSSHQHQRGTHFTAWNPLGEKIFENFDWAHPAILEFEDPYVLAPGDYIEYQCDYDNGVEREVRRCGDSRFDAGCEPGEPRTVTFGVTAQDEMCFLTGFYYTD